MELTRDEAFALLREYNEDSFHIKHALTVEGVMRYFAKDLGYGDEEEFWGIVGLLHDLDFERYPDQHCIKSQEILRVLYAVDELTGLIGATALMHPSRSVSDLELKSVKKKFKTPSFAAGCSRQVISQGADMLGWSLDDLISRTILAMRATDAVD